MLTRSTTTKCLSCKNISRIQDTYNSIRVVSCLYFPCNEKQYIGPVEEYYPGVYLKTTRLNSIGSSMALSNSLLPGGYNQIRYSYTDTMPKLYKLATNFEKYKKDKDVPMSVQKNIYGYTSVMLAGGSIIWLGKATCDFIVDYLGPDKLVQATSTLKVDLSKIKLGEYSKYRFRGKTIFIQHRSPETIAEMRKVPLNVLIDPEEDEKRFINPKWLVVEAICPHLGCVPTVGEGDYHGFFCPCHGSHFDKSGRIRKGPSPRNLRVPSYEIIDENTLMFGSS